MLFLGCVRIRVPTASGSGAEAIEEDSGQPTGEQLPIATTGCAALDDALAIGSSVWLPHRTLATPTSGTTIAFTLIAQPQRLEWERPKLKGILHKTIALRELYQQLRDLQDIPNRQE